MNQASDWSTMAEVEPSQQQSADRDQQASQHRPANSGPGSPFGPLRAGRHRRRRHRNNNRRAPQHGEPRNRYEDDRKPAIWAWRSQQTLDRAAGRGRGDFATS